MCSIISARPFAIFGGARERTSGNARDPANRRDAVKKIVVVGYPKSGCTWATRLVAELVGCPVAGFWQSDKKEIAVEGEHRVSDFRCYKSHHQLAELGLQPNDPDVWLIYVLRDPRDIAISAANYFQFDRFPRLAALFRSVRRGEKLYRHTLYPLLVSQNYRLDRMTGALLHGSAEVHNWCRVSWREHWRPYEQAGVPIIRYEDLLVTPEEQSRTHPGSFGDRTFGGGDCGGSGKPIVRAQEGGAPAQWRDRAGEIPAGGKERPMARKTPGAFAGALCRRTGRGTGQMGLLRLTNRRLASPTSAVGFVRAIFESADLSAAGPIPSGISDR